MYLGFEIPAKGADYTSLVFSDVFCLYFEFDFYRIDNQATRRRYLICYTYWFPLRFVDFPGTMAAHHWSPCTHCELKSKHMPYTVRMKNKYTYASIFFLDIFSFRAGIFLSSLTFDGYLCSVPMSVDCWIKEVRLFREICCHLFAIRLHMC